MTKKFSIHLSLHDRKAARDPKVRRWLKLVEEEMNKKITPELLQAYVEGRPILWGQDGSITILKPEDLLK